jgi:hypothetical protein
MKLTEFPAAATAVGALTMLAPVAAVQVVAPTGFWKFTSNSAPLEYAVDENAGAIIVAEAMLALFWISTKLVFLLIVTVPALVRAAVCMAPCKRAPPKRVLPKPSFAKSDPLRPTVVSTYPPSVRETLILALIMLVISRPVTGVPPPAELDISTKFSVVPVVPVVASQVPFRRAISPVLVGIPPDATLVPTADDSVNTVPTVMPCATLEVIVTAAVLEL